MMHPVLQAAIFTAAAVATAGAQAPCTRKVAPSTAVVFIEPAPAGDRDSVRVARVCLASAKLIGSYTGTISYDSTRMRVERVETRGGVQAANARTAGFIRIAGAAPNGFTNGVLATIAFRPRAGRTLSRIALTLSEINTTNGISLLGEARSIGWPAVSTVRTAPVIDSIRPRSAEISHERVTDVVLYGRGFAQVGNTIDFGGARVVDLASEKGGTVIRFLAPTEVPADGARAAHRMEPGRIEVRVRHAGGVSNRVTFTVRGDS
jgi:hypothetical protein